MRRKTKPVSGVYSLMGLMGASAQARFALALDRFPGRTGSLLFVIGLGWTLAVTLGSARVADAVTGVDVLLHPAGIAFAAGVALYPARKLGVPLIGFILLFALGVIIFSVVGREGGIVPTELGLGFLTNLVVAVAAGTLARREMLSPRYRSDPETGVIMGGVVLIAALVIGYTILASLILMSGALANSAEVAEVVAAAAFRSAKLAMGSAATLLLLLQLPGRRQLAEIAWLMPAFLLLSLGERAGYSVHTGIDISALVLLILLIRPIDLCLSALVAGTMLVIGMTGTYAAQPHLVEAHDYYTEVIAVLFLALTVLLAARMHRDDTLHRQHQDTLDRVARTHDLSNTGYFVSDVLQGTIRFDPVAQRILNLPEIITLGRMLQRARPEDRKRIAPSDDAVEELSRFHVRVCRKGDWTEGCQEIILSVFAVRESLIDGRTLAYGKLMDVTAEHRQEELLAGALKELSEQQDRQTQLFSVISHELRAPASVVSMLADDLDEGASWTSVGRQIRASIDQMLSVLADMRQTVRPEQNLPIREESFTAEGLANSIRDSYLGMARNKGIEIDLRIGSGGEKKRATDRIRVQQALSNLVRNAIIHSRATVISIAYREEGSPEEPVAIWRVWDNGRNIPPDLVEKLFQPFSRDRNDPGRADGSGLGLYIARSSIQLLGGDLAYVARTNTGAEFRIQLPVRAVADEAAAPPAAARDDNQGRWTDQSVLLVEDSPTMGSLMETRLSRVFGRVEWAKSGAEALEIMRRMTPDLILSDYYMPGMTGDELVSHLREQGWTGAFIGMTAAELGDECDRLLAAGANAVLTKPIRTDQLIETLEEVSQSGSAAEERSTGT